MLNSPNCAEIPQKVLSVVSRDSARMLTDLPVPEKTAIRVDRQFAFSATCRSIQFAHGLLSLRIGLLVKRSASPFRTAPVFSLLVLWPADHQAAAFVQLAATFRLAGVYLCSEQITFVLS